MISEGAVSESGAGGTVLRFGVLGSTVLTVDGTPVRLTPLTIRLLVRLVAAEGDAVAAQQLYSDVWQTPATTRHQRTRNRNEVQKRILELRRALDPGRSGAAAEVLRTEQVLTGAEPESAYRLLLRPEQLDAREFADTVSAALHAAPGSAVTSLTGVIGLWRGRPLADAGDAHYATAMARRLTDLYKTARHELMQLHIEFGRPEQALPLAEQMSAEQPQDPAWASQVRALREQIRARNRGDMLRLELPELHATVSIQRGDLFDQHDANLVVGFTDTFDTVTTKALVISPHSVQGQLLDRVFDGDIKELDRALRQGLQHIEPVGREQVRDKPKGKRIRYPIGTVAPLFFDERRVFAVAYSTLNNELVARSSIADLRHSLGLLWISVARYGLMKPVAMPLLGAGLARIHQQSPEDLIITILDTFVRACRELFTVTPELRIVLRPSDLERIRLPEIARFVEMSGAEGKTA